jgi:hypothetical protein
VAVADHGGGQVCAAAGLGSQIAEHGVGFPASEESYAVGIGVRVTEKGSGPTRSEAIRGYFFRRNAGDVLDSGSRLPQLVGNTPSGDVLNKVALRRILVVRAMRHVVVDVGFGWHLVKAEMNDTPKDSPDRAKEGVSSGRETLRFVPCTVFLVSVGERHVVGTNNVIKISGKGGNRGESWH